MSTREGDCQRRTAAAGTHSLVMLGRLRGRFNPARAGNTTAREPVAGAAGLQPRACGEHVRQPEVVGHALRFIPARAGNTDRPAARGGPLTVHPRACGEHASLSSRSSPEIGSSPRVRGTPPSRGPWPGRSRFIPARAGNTCRAASGRRPRPVHPRACGEHPASMVPLWEVFGSSPRLRGTLDHAAQGPVSGRFIPARAGNTNGGSWTGGSWPVHPRACGEHRAASAGVARQYGSSPRVRGTLSLQNTDKNRLIGWRRWYRQVRDSGLRHRVQRRLSSRPFHGAARAGTARVSARRNRPGHAGCRRTCRSRSPLPAGSPRQ